MTLDAELAAGVPEWFVTVVNDEINDELNWAIGKLMEHRQTHVEWRDWFRKHPDDPRKESLGDADFHNETVQTYNMLIAVAEACREERLGTS